MEGEKDSPPLWPQLTTTLVRRRRRSPPAILNPVLLIILLPALALLVVFLLLPNFLSHTSQILLLNSVKNRWDSLNILLVLFAIVCGVLARQSDEGSSTVEADGNVASSVSFISKKHQSNSTEWFERSDRKEYDPRQVGTPETGAGRLRRNGCWYPDLRQDRWREAVENSLLFFDDFQVNMYRSSASDDVPRRPRRSQPESDDSVAKLVPADTFVNRDFSPPKKSPEPPAPLPPPPLFNRKPKRSSGDVAFEDKVEKRSSCTAADFQKSRSGPLPPPAPPQQASIFLRSLRKTASTKDIGTTIASLYNYGKGKKGKTKNVGDNANHSPPSTNSIPPPPPPPPSMFHNLFKKGSKNKPVHPTPPPPPPPRRSVFDTILKNGSKSWRFRSDAPSPQSPPKPLPSVLSNILKNGTKSKPFQSTRSCNETQPPTAPPPPSSDYSPVAAGSSPLPTKTSTYHKMNEKMSSGMQSPLIPTTLPPPLPPVKGPEMKFVARGDLFNVPCTHSPSCSSPKLEDSKESSNVMDGGDAISSVFCPSPDVNFKADTFIARHREEWRLEKMNSFKERQNMG